MTTTTTTSNEYANNPFCCSICYWCCFQTHLITNHVMGSVILCMPFSCFSIAFSHFFFVYVCVYRLWLYGFALTHSSDAVRPLSPSALASYCVRECCSAPFIFHSNKRFDLSKRTRWLKLTRKEHQSVYVSGVRAPSVCFDREHLACLPFIAWNGMLTFFEHAPLPN